MCQNAPLGSRAVAMVNCKAGLFLNFQPAAGFLRVAPGIIQVVQRYGCHKNASTATTSGDISAANACAARWQTAVAIAPIQLSRSKVFNTNPSGVEPEPGPITI